MMRDTNNMNTNINITNSTINEEREDAIRCLMTASTSTTNSAASRGYTAVSSLAASLRAPNCTAAAAAVTFEEAHHAHHHHRRNLETAARVWMQELVTDYADIRRNCTTAAVNGHDDDDDDANDENARRSNNDDDDDDDGSSPTQTRNDAESATVATLLRRIANNEIVHLLLRNVRIFDDVPVVSAVASAALPVSVFRTFDPRTLQRLTAALPHNQSIRAISCHYDNTTIVPPSPSSSSSVVPSSSSSLALINVPTHSKTNNRIGTTTTCTCSTGRRRKIGDNRMHQNHRYPLSKLLEAATTTMTVNTNTNATTVVAATNRRHRSESSSSNIADRGLVVSSIHGYRNYRDEISNSNSSNNRNNRGNRYYTYNTVTRYEERSLIAACVCLPRLEAVSITGGNKGWTVAHLITILESVVGLKRLKIHDLVIHSHDELHQLHRCLVRLKAARQQQGLPLEDIDFIIEDQTAAATTTTTVPDDDDDHHTASSSSASKSSTTSSLPPSPSVSVFDELLRIFLLCPCLKRITITKSMLSRFDYKTVFLFPRRRNRADISTHTLLALANKYPTLSKLVFHGFSYQRTAIETLCHSLIHKTTTTKNQCNKNKKTNTTNKFERGGSGTRTGHGCGMNNTNNINNNSTTNTMEHLEFTGCGFYNSIDSSDWNALFRLIKHDPKIQIVASSPIYQRRSRQREQPRHHHQRQVRGDRLVAGKGQKRKGYHDGWNNNNNTDADTDDDSYYSRRNGSIQRPCRDFSFSLRDKHGIDQHFYNRGMEIEYILQEAGFFRLLQQQQQRSQTCTGGETTSSSGAGRNDSGDTLKSNTNPRVLDGRATAGTKIRDEKYHENHNIRTLHTALLTPPPLSQPPSTNLDWIIIMSKVKDDSIALFYILRENPILCAKY